MRRDYSLLYAPEFLEPNGLEIDPTEYLELALSRGDLTAHTDPTGRFRGLQNPQTGEIVWVRVDRLMAYRNLGLSTN